jgi:excinuclease ABC subunit C
VHSLKEAVTRLQKAFKFRTCHLDIRQDDSNKRFFRPCLLYAIKQCTAPCADKIPRDAYNDDVKRLIRFLDGGRKSVLRDLEKEMKEASENLKFERAARIRDELKSLQSLDARG